MTGFLHRKGVMDFLCQQRFLAYKSSKGSPQAMFCNVSAAWMYDHLNASRGVEIANGAGTNKTLVADRAARRSCKESAELESTIGGDVTELIKKHLLMHYFDTLIKEGKTL